MDISKYRELTDEEILRAVKMAMDSVESYGDQFKDIAGRDYTNTILGMSIQTAMNMIIDEKNKERKY